jgi:fatty acid desaturase
MATADPALDYAAFASELDALRQRLEAELAPQAAAHLRRQARWGRLCTALGYATAWIAPNPFSAVFLALGMSARWTIVAHHTSHRALDRVGGDVAPHETSKAFAKGARRWFDWFDWLDPAAWDYEHNKLHHYHTGEVSDPDLVEEQLRWLREFPAPHWLKRLAVLSFASTWKFTYYAPNIYALHRREIARRAEGRAFDPSVSTTDVDFVRTWTPWSADGARFWRDVVVPYLGLRLGLVPLLFLPLGAWAAMSVLVNSVFAELLTGLHTFVIVVPNHAGEDMHRYDRPTTDRAEFYVRQVLGSVNFRTGGELNDFLHGYLNYQVEHHLWPDAPPLLYVHAAPAVKEICARHGVRYTQEGVFRRVGMLLDIMTGRASMVRGTTLAKSERRVPA